MLRHFLVTTIKLATSVASCLLDRYGATIGYEYHLSQRTNFYTAASYMKTTYDFGEKTDQKATEVLAGIRHIF